MKVLLYFLFVLLLNYIKCEDHDLPSYFTPCDPQVPNEILNECLKNQMRANIGRFAKGVPELGVPSLDPINIDDIHLDGKGLKLTISNGKVYGLSNTQIPSVTLNMESGNIEVKFNTDVKVLGTYIADGQILILPIQGNGDATISARNVAVVLSATLDIKKDHFKLIHPIYNYTIEQTTFKFDNLFNGNKEVSDVTHKFANENWQQIMDDLAPPAIQQIIKTVLKAINHFFAKVPVSKLFAREFPDVKWS